MKFTITIDTEKKTVTTYPNCPIFVRTGFESKEELELRRKTIHNYENPIYPDWLEDIVMEISQKL